MSIWSRLKSLAGGHGVLRTLASASTLRIPDDDNAYYVSGSTTVTALTVANHLRNREVTLIGAASAAVPFTNTTGSTTAGQMDLGGGDLTLSAKDVMKLFIDNNGVAQLVSIRANNATSVSVASATTTTVPGTGNVFVLTGSATITGLSATDNDSYREVTFIGGASAAVVFTNTESPSSAGEMYLQGSNRLLQEQDVIKLTLQPDGWWFLVSSTTG